MACGPVSVFVPSTCVLDLVLQSMRRSKGCCFPTGQITGSSSKINVNPVEAAQLEEETVLFGSRHVQLLAYTTHTDVRPPGVHTFTFAGEKTYVSPRYSCYGITRALLCSTLDITRPATQLFPGIFLPLFCSCMDTIGGDSFGPSECPHHGVCA